MTRPRHPLLRSLGVPAPREEPDGAPSLCTCGHWSYNHRSNGQDMVSGVGACVLLADSGAACPCERFTAAKHLGFSEPVTTARGRTQPMAETQPGEATDDGIMARWVVSRLAGKATRFIAEAEQHAISKPAGHGAQTLALIAQLGQVMLLEDEEAEEEVGLSPADRSPADPYDTSGDADDVSPAAARSDGTAERAMAAFIAAQQGEAAAYLKWSRSGTEEDYQAVQAARALLADAEKLLGPEHVVCVRFDR